MAQSSKARVKKMVDEPAGDVGKGPAAEPTRRAEPPRPPVLRRSRSDRVIAGVCAGLGHYLGIDPVLVRIAAVVVVIGTFFSGIVAYLVAWWLIPEEKPGEVTERPITEGNGTETARYVVGGALVLIGGIWFLDRIVPWVDAGAVGAVVLIAVGVVILAQGIRR